MAKKAFRLAGAVCAAAGLLGLNQSAHAQIFTDAQAELRLQWLMMKREMPRHPNPEVQRFAECIARSIVNVVPPEWQELDWEIIVFDSDSANASVTPEGKIAVFSGLLQVANTPDRLAAVLGHNYSPWVGFRGGKGIATSAGVFLALMPVGVALLAVVWLVAFLATRYVSVASMIAAAALPLITLYGSWSHGKIADGTWNKPLFVFSVVIAILAIWKHRANIQRLRDGTENRFTRTKPTPAGHV